MSNRIYVPYVEAKNLLQEADILLFRTTGFISALIRIAGEGEYSHVAIATQHNGEFEVAEYREWYGSRIINLENYIKICKQDKTEIDVYRPIRSFTSIKYNPVLREFDTNIVEFDGKKVTECMRKLSGMPYSYRRILIILKMKLFKWHILWDIEKITRELPTDELVMPVCSTSLHHCFNKHNFPLLRHKSDEYFEPSDFSISPRLNYIFTLSI